MRNKNLSKFTTNHPYLTMLIIFIFIFFIVPIIINIFTADEVFGFTQLNFKEWFDNWTKMKLPWTR